MTRAGAVLVVTLAALAVTALGSPAWAHTDHHRRRAGDEHRPGTVRPRAG